MARVMNDSGIEWIGEIPEGWECKKLKFCSQFVQQKYDDMSDNSLPYIGLENVVSWNGRYIETDSQYDKEQSVLFQKGDILWGKLRPYLAKVYHAKSDGYCSGEFCVIRIGRQYSDRYFWNLLISSEFVSTVDRSTYGTKMPRANADFIKNVVVPVPPINEQSRIADFLDAECARIDAVIEQTRASIEEYKKLKQSVITEAVTKGIRPGRKMKDSGIEWVKELPEDWAVIPSKYLFRNSDMRRLDNDEQMTASQQYGIITQAQYMELTGAKVVFANKGLEDWKHVEPYDFIISLRSFQGGLEMSETTGCITWHYIVLKPCKPIYSYYFKWLFKSELYIKALQRTCNFIRDGQDLRYSNFVQVPLFEPSLEEQKGIADYLNKKCAEIDQLISKKESFAAELESYKKSLIFEYVTGKKEVVRGDTECLI